MSGNVLFSDGFSPGASPALVSFENLAFDGTALLSIELGGLAAGTQFDRLIASGAAALGGTLEVVLLDGFLPAPGDRFEILSWGSRSGAFAGYAGLDLGGGLVLEPRYGASDLTLVAIPEPGTFALLGVSRRRRRGGR